MGTIGKTCPECNTLNDDDAGKCAYCGASLEGDGLDPTTFTMKNTKLSPSDGQKTPETAEFPSSIPSGAIAIYVVGENKPIDLTEEEEIILGRRVIEGIDKIVDLTPFGGMEKGVSRKHALIRKIGSGYEIVDLYSTNGTWINEKRLLPNKVYPLESGIQIRLGQLLMFTLFGQMNR